ncbi:MAG: chorismate-binding protein [Terriglobus roseus]|nr:chorismate-binding protein [Terriglobus roseus]
MNRVCDPRSTRVDKLMVVQRFSHVQHLTSEVSGSLRPGKTRFDAFRSIFPAGTTSGAPKVRAMELIAELEGEKRGIYAGAVGYFGYETVEDGRVSEGAMDTCIALRTMLVKDGVAYLQAGGGIVFGKWTHRRSDDDPMGRCGWWMLFSRRADDGTADSDPYDEYVETLNKLGASMQCISRAEQRHLEAQQMRSEGAATAGMTSVGSGSRSSNTAQQQQRQQQPQQLADGTPVRVSGARVDLAA